MKQEELKKYGYSIEQDFDGDSDNYVRYLIIYPDGSIYKRGIYEYELDAVVKKLVNIIIHLHELKKY